MRFPQLRVSWTHRAGRSAVNLRAVTAIVLLIVLVGMPAGSTLADAAVGGTGNRCPAGTVCDHALGVAVTPPTNWRVLPAGKLPPHTIGLYALPVSGPDYNVRLIVASDGTTHVTNDVRAATQAARAFTHGYDRLHMRPPLVELPVRYGGAPGIMIRNLPGQPTLVVAILLAHHGALYGILAPGATMGPDQVRTLRSVRFIPRVGPFPPANPAAPRNRGLGLSVAPVSVPGAVNGSTVAIDEPVRAIAQTGP
jgi:hypothetical protein